MLLERIVNYCHAKYQTADTSYTCENCNHPEKTCPGINCKSCLDEVHFSFDHPGGKIEYDCPNMLNFYVCSYSHKYCSEIEYALSEIQSLKTYKRFHVMSIGCGACPDLMALEFFNKKSDFNKPISYRGYDINELWKPVHEQIKKYCTENNFNIRIDYVDVVKYFNEYTVKGANLLFLQYIISYFYNTNQIREIDDFFNNLVASIVTKKDKGENFTIIINDVNSCYRGRDYFYLLVEKLEKYDLHGMYSKRYFNYGIKNDFQRYGQPYNSCDNIHVIPAVIKEQYNPAIYCSSAQLIIEVK